jgi:hypothetical protein
MSRQRYTPRPTPDVHGQPFPTAEEAWFWAVTTHDNIQAGARVRAGRSSLPRPCDARDVIGVVARLHRAGRLSRDHLEVLFRFGRRSSPPDPRVEEERPAERVWLDALARLLPPLEAKGIVGRADRRWA